ncbi:MAG: hypothetical protein ACR2PZ_13540 [Pseudomonadales bacterium]
MGSARSEPIHVLWFKAGIAPLVLLAIVYAGCRLLFQQFVILKTGFIYPSGWLVSLFYGTGNYAHPDWVYHLDHTRFVLGETCSGTTFFSLLLAYTALRIHTHRIRWYWLLLAFPLALLANSMRVLSAISAERLLSQMGMVGIGDAVHVVVGAMTFLCAFIGIAYCMERSVEQ